MNDPFNLSGRVAVITGGAGLLGFQHASAIASAGGTPVLVDIDAARAEAKAAEIGQQFGVPAAGFACDITQPEKVSQLLDTVLARFGRVDILINNAANNPRVEASAEVNFSRLENFPLAQWEADIAVGVTGAFLCCKTFGTHMAKSGGGVILNVASDLAIIGPDQRIYRQPGTAEHMQPVKPITYSVVKSALIGLTRYLATYWADKHVRVNAISPGGVANNQPEDFVERLTNLIPMGRMANVDEYRGAILFLCSDASSYMTGANLVVDGGRTCW
ncbi:short-chain dehydrogenase/reductase SDR [Candidatus Koribacter versatilis Ellin345]|uniref:Short-chain dehydrogenase/reductase SDR n=1 Tax=Koribacter versatilis (strain Ellin345) TaxID=204669 RepID=Q1IMQ3_KORVE|nr:SDR family oxidoreductase [Candidatus Koribacter versatilis]ABF41847.1 short-chain dehydrogenase/reductase SDR [Candidatus Koribacter versatilis Ellin345]